MAFSIKLLNEAPDPALHGPARWGLLQMGSYSERFVAPLHFWKAGAYEGHWKQAVQRIIDGEQKSCLITSMYDPAGANFIVWWPMYRVEDEVLIQNHMLFMNELQSPFDPLNPYVHIPERIVPEPGERISQWTVQISDFTQFIKAVQ